jgi:hypothetical protein
MIDPDPPSLSISDIVTLIDASRNNGAYIRRICEVLKADSGTLWSNQGTTFSRDVFVLKAVFNREDIKSRISKEIVDITYPHVVASDAFSSKAPIYGTYGESPFDSAWQSKPYTSGLKSRGIAKVAVVPLFDSEERPSGFVSLYFNTAIQYVFLVQIGRVISSISETMSKTVGSMKLELRKDKHEILTHTSIIERKMHEIKNASYSILPDNDMRKGLLRKIDDAAKSINILRKSYAAANFRSRIDERRDSSIQISIRAFIYDTIHAVNRNYQHNNITRGPISGSDFSIKFNFEDLTMLLTNLYENAFKYASTGSVKTILESSRYDGLIVIKNDVISQHSENLQDIWDYEIRGERASQSKIPGQGIGLGIVNDICDVYDVHARAFYEEDGSRGYVKQFCVALEFSRPVFVG